ncbi:MAG: sigma-54-dependent Fis family transcriptional regulator [Gammaproteobacteria bacterium]|nr:sigma-54 dependent transcriptional regulator [Gammaproteobacteria bacterium]MBU6510011.1 sigma-54 dependent transcriptional regulator [Gammaproteobacteria bacterium]MDE2109162.1 sigma-54-dependent Fis family transcriptional regulator [Gammaproteobacteria bacterium]MDE2459926.1 sigma-54-dependent Fis family transcriptional regulator [Gammaproteobacteria bacterium]
MPASQILVVDDEADIRDMVQEILTEEGYQVQVAGSAAEARSARRQGEPDLVLLDIWMPDMDGISLLKEWTREQRLPFPVVMMSGHGSVDTAIEATRLGALDFVEKPLSLAKLLRTVEQAIASRRHAPGAPSALGLSLPQEPFGKSREMQRLREQCQRAAAQDSPVLLLGESGSGRESAARHMHALSAYAAGPFVNAVLANLRGEQAEARLLGREQDGKTEAGWLDAAGAGMLFLNELTDLEPAAQQLLLGVLEQGQYTRVGGREPQTLDARILASALPEIEKRVSDGRFRRDLYERLAGVLIQVPALRSYLEDVPELLRYYSDALADSDRIKYRRFSVAAQNRLRNYPWPGNLAELRNLVQRFLVLGDDSEVSLEEVEAVLTPFRADGPLVNQDLLSLPLREAREHFERAYLEQQLQLCGGKVGKLAERVGMERTHLYRKLNSLGIDFRQSGIDDNE